MAVFSNSFTGSVAIPDNNATGITSILAISGVPTGAFLSQIRVSLNITHTFDGDLDIFLIDPEGNQIELSTNNGGTGDNYTNTVFVDSATTTILAGAAPFTGSFQPEQALSTLYPGAINGNWTLKVVDEAGQDFGTLTNWSIDLSFGEASRRYTDSIADARSTVSASRDGNFSVSWNNGYNNGNVANQIFAADGVSVLGQVGVSFNAVEQMAASTFLRDGRHALAFVSNFSGNRDVQLKIDSGPTFSGQDAAPSLAQAGDQVSPMVAELSDGNLIVAYVDVTSNTLQGRIFNTTTNTFGAAVTLTKPGATLAALPDPSLQPSNLIALSGGGFAVSYLAANSNLNQSVFDNTIANPVFRIDGAFSGDRSPEALVQLADGTILGMAWQQSGNALLLVFSSSTGVYQTVVATFPSGLPAAEFHNLRATALLDGRVMVVGSSLVEGAVAGSDIWGQVINANGTLDGAAFRINGDNLAGAQSAPDIATLADGRVVVTWTDHSTNSGDIMRQIIDIRSTGVNLVGTGSLNDTWIGSRFNDTMQGGLGNDVLNGGAGTNDVISFAGFVAVSGTTGVAVNLGLQGGAQTTGAGSDTFTNFEDITGSAFNDQLIGDLNNNIIRGGAGNDDLNGGGGVNQLYGDGGDDYLVVDPLSGNTEDAIYDGGANTDELYIQGNGTTVTDLRNDTVINLETLAFGSLTPPNTTVRFNANQFTQFQTVEAQGLTGQVITIDITMGTQTAFDLTMLAITGLTQPNDRFIITGDADGEVIAGSRVNDTIDTGGGSDIVSGGAGNDTLTGGSGNDRFLYSPGNDVITDFRAQYYAANLNAANEVPANASTATGSASFMLNGAQTSIASTVNLTGLSAGLTAMHLHNGAAGINGPVVVDIGTGSIFGLTSGTVTVVRTVNAGNVTALNAGNVYINAHTSNFPGGEIRGQLAAVGTAVDTIDVQGRNIGDFASLQLLLASSGGNALLSTVYNGVTSTLTINGMGGLLTAGDFILQTAAHNNIFGGTVNADDLFGAAGDDQIQGLGARDQLFGESGNDILNGGLGADLLVGGSGWDTASYANATTTVQVVMYNTAYNTGEALGDIFNGIEALQGSSNTDILVGDFASNAILGGLGADWIDGTYGQDYLYGEGDNDDIASRDLADYIDGGADFDTVRYDFATSGLKAYLYDTAQNTGFAAGDTLVSIEGIVGSYFSDDLRGDAGVNVIQGLNGDDFIIGLGGGDLLIGGNGYDLFHYISTADGGDGIQDFVSGVDRISVTGAFFGLGSPGGAAIDYWRFVAGTEATVASAQFIYDAASQYVWYDQDGTGAGAKQLLAVLQTGATLAYTDILVL